ncbi:MAG: insulinase family protein [Bacteroidetes bacterium]|nr:insulinase family protein [Bacteroidota bacterium]
MTKLKILMASVCLFMLLAAMGVNAQNYNFDLNAKVPVSADVKTGVLKNGMHYYIRKNGKPEKRVEMRLAVNVGSMMEEENQLGVAHFCEHMCFNGTKNFKKSELVDYLESIGTRFGADLNAYTSFDETVYMLQMPTDKPEFIGKGFQILEDWAHNVTFDDTEIDKERGVVIEEWRLGRGAEDRMFNKTAPVIFAKSRYADRLPIGTKASLDKFTHEDAKSFYRTWYRPDLQSVMVVGDVDIAQMEKMIIEKFSNIPAATSPKPRINYNIPYHKETYVAIATDKEAQYAVIDATFCHAKLPVGTVKDYRANIVNSLFTRMLNARYDELRSKSNPPFLYSGTNIGPFMREQAGMTVYAVANTKDIDHSIRSMYEELERVKKFGFTQTELDRAKKATLKGMEDMFKERNKTESRGLIDELVRNFLQQEVIPGIEWENAANKKFVPEITLAEVNGVSAEWIKNENNSIVFTGPEKDDIKIPNQEGIQAIISSVTKEDVKAYDDKVSDKPLLGKKPTAGKVVSEKVMKEINVTEWTLSNGAKVILKPTDYKDNEIILNAFSMGGHSLSTDADMISAMTSADIINYSGLGDFDNTALQKLLTGKTANVSPSIGELMTNLSGESSNEDFETMMQMLYLYFTAPRNDKEGYDAYTSQMMGSLQNQYSSPEGVYYDSLQIALSNNHPRRRPMTVEKLSQINLDKAVNFYKQRFTGAGNFTFVFVGSFKPENIKAMVEQYIGGLPAGNKETWKDLGIHSPKGVVKKTITKGTEPKSRVSLTLNGSFAYTAQNRFELDATTKVLSIMLREVMREDKSGVYGVGCYPSATHYPREEYSVTVGFGCSPDNADMLTKTVFEQMELLKKDGPSEKNMVKVKETMLRTREVDSKTNNFWSNMLRNVYFNGGNPVDVLKYNDFVNKLDAAALKKAANTYLKTDNMVQVTLMPEKKN